MKNAIRLLQSILPLIFMFAITTNASGQIFKKLGKAAERAAERTVERRVETETSKKTDEVLDSILEPGSKGEEEKRLPVPNDGPSEDPQVNDQGPNVGTTGGSDTSAGSGDPKTISVYSKFDFVPGDKLLFFDDFSNDFIGDFPSKWNTNGSGEVVTIGDSQARWMEILAGYSTYYVPDVPSLPEEYTIEFDLYTMGLDKKTSSSAHLEVYLSDDPTFKRGNSHVKVDIPFCQYSAIGIRAKNFEKGRGGDVNNVVKADLRKAVLEQPHIAIAVNKQRYRLWVNEKKYLDIPRMIAETSQLTTLKFALEYTQDAKERIFISNLKVAEGGVDLRRKLISEGKISTNGILFDSGSANIQPQSMGIIRQISQVLQQEGSMNLKIVGHTDSDGDDGTNMSLSKKRADAVKFALVSIYNVSENRLSTEGKGESEPFGDNGTADGKAQNRRVEFIKM